MLRAITVATLLVGMVGGCARPVRPMGYQTIGQDPNRNTAQARKDSTQALRLLKDGKVAEAEELLKKALTADVMFGPAHNNLGLVYFRAGQLYLAAWEFQYASRLMPHQPEPRNNLGLVLEAAGKLDEAIKSYDDALRLEPDNPQLLGNAARARVRKGDKSDELRDMLEKLVMRDTRPDWIEWARKELAMRGKSKEN